MWIWLRCSLCFFSSRRRHTRSLCDWSSDVCSSDLSIVFDGRRSDTGWILAVEDNGPGLPEDELALLGRRYTRGRQSPMRSEERRVGKECRSRWSPYH